MMFCFRHAAPFVAFFIGFISSVVAQSSTHTKPNIIIIFTDDQGYQDLSCYGSPQIRTPNICQLANEGIRFTDFYVSASVCSPSRASLLTGRLPARNGVTQVYFPDSQGMASTEVTIAEVLHTVGYRTACFGKWHLGDWDENMPTKQGFDTYFGIPYSNDMYIAPRQHFSKQVVFREGYTLEQAQDDQGFISQVKRNTDKIKERHLKERCPLMEGTEIVEYPCDQSTLTQRYFERAMQFIDQADSKPFFIYLTPAMPHVPLFASEKFAHTSPRGTYGDVVEEIDWYVGKLMQQLKAKGLEKNTIVIFTSDNGPWLGYGNQAGSAEPLREGKFTNYEGGLRVPCVMRWTGVWETGKTSHALVSSMDLLPTLAHYAGAKLPSVVLDGVNLAPHLERVSRASGREHVLYSKGGAIEGIRIGDWKYLPHGGARASGPTSAPELFNLKDDLAETRNVYTQHPDVVQKLAAELEKYRATLKQPAKKSSIDKP